MVVIWKNKNIEFSNRNNLCRYSPTRPRSGRFLSARSAIRSGDCAERSDGRSAATRQGGQLLYSSLVNLQSLFLRERESAHLPSLSLLPRVAILHFSALSFLPHKEREQRVCTTDLLSRTRCTHAVLTFLVRSLSRGTAK